MPEIRGSGRLDMTCNFFSRTTAGQPATREVMLMGLIGEELAINSLMAYERYFSRGDFPVSCKFNSVIKIDRRKECQVYKLVVYETHRSTVSGVSFLSTCLKDGEATVMAQGRRPALDRISKLSEYPHLDETVERACTEYGINTVNLVWRIY
jgi:hypothetical protein